jgi:Family of unknown function (DUF6412)
MSWIALFTLNPADVLVVAAVAVVAMAIVFAARAIGALPSAPARVPAVPARARSRHPAVIRQIDPDAAGRPRPRAPGF